jgi:hypothetical protein
MNFTLILPSRGRTKQLERFLFLCETSTFDKSNTEIIITADDDDNETINLLKSWGEKTKFDFTLRIGPRPESLTEVHNDMAKIAKGRYIFALNDDAELMTNHWDTIALKYIKDFQDKHQVKDDIVYGYPIENSVDKIAGKRYAAFAIISAQAVQTLGYFMYNRFYGHGGDSALYKIYEAVNRVIDMPDILIDHVYHNSLLRVYTPDKTGYEMRVKSQQSVAISNLDPFTIDLSNDIKLLKEFIDSKNI